MKYIIGIFSAFALFSCRDTEKEPAKYNLHGSWKPVKEVVTTTLPNNSSTSSTYIYGDCQQSTLYTFHADKTGHLVKNELRNNSCVNAYETPFTYEYKQEDGKFHMESTFNGHEEGHISFHNSDVMNLKLVAQDENTNAITTVVYTLHRIN